jgi:hypothetical protein
MSIGNLNVTADFEMLIFQFALICEGIEEGLKQASAVTSSASPPPSCIGDTKPNPNNFT